PGFALADEPEGTSLEIESVGSLKGDDARVGLAVLGIEHVAPPLVVARLGGAVHDYSSDLAFSALILDGNDLAAQLAAAIIEIDLRAGRRPQPRPERLLRASVSGKGDSKRDSSHSCENTSMIASLLAHRASPPLADRSIRFSGAAPHEGWRWARARP